MSRSRSQSPPSSTPRNYATFKPKTAEEVLEKLEHLLYTSTTNYKRSNPAPPSTPLLSKGRRDSHTPNRRHSNIGARLDEKTEDKQLIQAESTNDVEVISHQPANLRGELRDYQLEGLRWMVNLHNSGINGILADEMGLGKSLQTISLLAYLRETRNISGKHLIVIPKSIMGHWAKEFETFYPYFNVVSLRGDKDERAQCIRQELPTADVVLVTYEVCLIEFSSLSKIFFEYIILDEAHRIKNDQGKTSMALKKLRSAHRLLLTGTPLQNNMRELWSLLNFLRPDLFSDSDEFELLYTSPTSTNDKADKVEGPGGASDKESSLMSDGDEAEDSPMQDEPTTPPEEESSASSSSTPTTPRQSDTETPESEQDQILRRLHRILRPFILRRLKKDAAKSLPPKVETKLYVKLTGMQREQYRSLLSRDIDCLNTSSANSEKTRLLNIMMQLRKCCNHPYLFDGVEPEPFENGQHLIDVSGKLRLLDKLLPKLQREGSRVLIFSQMTRLLDILEDYCSFRDYEFCRIDGSTPHSEREDQIDAFNAKGSTIFIFLLSTRAGGLGINLQTADTVVLYDSDWNPQMDLQAMDRAHRIGQKRQVNVYRLVMEGTVEEKIVERALKKLALDALIVQKGRQLNSKDGQLKGNEIQDMIRFGANYVFQSSSDDITDEDIDLILESGRKRTEADNQKITEALVDIDKFSLSDTSSTDFNIQTFEGEKLAIKKNSGFFHIEPTSRLAAQKAVKKIALQNPQKSKILSIKPRPYRASAARTEWHLYDDLPRLLQLERKQWDAQEQARVTRLKDLEIERVNKSKYKEKFDKLQKRRRRQAKLTEKAQGEEKNDPEVHEGDGADADTVDDTDVTDTVDPDGLTDAVREEMAQDPQFAQYVASYLERRVARSQQRDAKTHQAPLDRSDLYERRRIKQESEQKIISSLAKQFGALTAAEEKELQRLYASGFPQWRRSDVHSLLEGVAIHGRDRLDLVLPFVPDKTLDGIKQYSDKFFQVWTTLKEYKRFLAHFNTKKNQFHRSQLLRGLLLQKLTSALVGDDESSKRTTHSGSIDLSRLDYEKITLDYSLSPSGSHSKQRDSYGKQWVPDEDKILCVVLYYCGFPDYVNSVPSKTAKPNGKATGDGPATAAVPEDKDGINYSQMLYVLKSIPQFATTTSILALTKEELKERCVFIMSLLEKEHRAKHKDILASQDLATPASAKRSRAKATSSVVADPASAPSSGNEANKQGPTKSRKTKATATAETKDAQTTTVPEPKSDAASSGAAGKPTVPTNTELGLPEVTPDMDETQRKDIARQRRNLLARIARQRRAQSSKAQDGD